MRKNAFLLIFLAFQMFGCNSDSHIEKLNAIDNYLNNITLSVESILKATPINGDVQNKRLDSLINVIDSLQVKWDLNIENIREKLSEEKINQLENESRNRMERIEQLLSRYYSEYDVIIEN